MASNILSKLKESDYEKLSDEDLQKISSGKFKNDEELLSNLSDQALMVIAGDKSPIPNLSKEPSKTSFGDAALIGAQKGVTLGFRPAVGGLGAGLGAMVGTQGGLKEKLAAFSPAYQEARGELLAEQEKASKDQPTASLVGELGGSAATLPFTALRGLKGAIGLGAASGAGQAVSEDKNIKDIALDTAKGGAIGGTAFGVAKGIEKLPDIIIKNGKFVSSEIEKLTPKFTTDAEKLVSEKLATKEVENITKNAATKQAADLLGVDATKGMLTQNMKTRGLESSLYQSPSVAGSLVRNRVEKVTSKMKSVVDELSKDKINKTAIQIGDSVKEEISNEIGKKYAPIKQLYNEIESQSLNIPLREKSKQAIVKNIETFANESLIGQPKQLALEISQQLSKAKNMTQLKALRSTVLAQIRDGVPSTQQALAPIAKKLNRAIDSNVLRAAADLSKESGQKLSTNLGKAISSSGDDYLSKFRTANKDYRELITELKDITEKSGIRKIYGPEDFVSAVQDIEPNVLVDKLFNTNKPMLLNQFKKNFPEQFESLRKLKVAEIFNSSLVKDEINPSKFIKATNKLEPEVRKIIFGEKFKDITTENAFDALEKLVHSIPEKIGPSGTPQGMQFQELLNPLFQTKEAARYLLYKGLPNAKTVIPPDASSVIQRRLTQIGAPMSRNADAISRIITPQLNESNSIDRRMQSLKNK